MPRSKKQPILFQNKLKISKDSVRFSTPEEVAIYRAKRLKCKRITEIGAGIGGQTIAFSKTCRKVLAIELDKEKADCLKQNLKKLNIKNVEVLVGDCLSEEIIEKVKEFSPEIIFCDTERPEKGERKIENITPPIKKILEDYSEITQKIAIEIPPFTKGIESIKEFHLEKEFISLNKQLNRLTLYFNRLKESEVSAISLPSLEKISYSHTELKEPNSLTNYKYLYVIDPTIIIAELIPELCEKFNCKTLKLKKPILVSNEKINSNFLTKYNIVKICKNNEKEILKNLKEIKAGKVILRYNLEPKDYWKIRNFYESQLNGNKEVSLFLNDSKDEAILTEN